MQRSEGFLGSRVKLSNGPTVLTVAIIDISELVPRDMGMVTARPAFGRELMLQGKGRQRAESRALLCLYLLLAS